MQSSGAFSGPEDFLFYKEILLKQSVTRTGVVRLTAFLFAVFCLPLAACCAESPKRIISLAPNITEMLYAVGAEDSIVGVSSFCDYPEVAKKKAKVGGMSNPSLEAVVSLKPDLVLFSIDGSPKAFEERLRTMKIKTFTLRSKRIMELPQGIRQIGAAVGAVEKAEKVAQEMEKKISDISEREKYRNLHRTTMKPKVLFIIWPDPLIVAGPGSITDDALRIVGAENIAGKAVSAYPKYSIEEILRQSPDVIFIGKGKGMDKVSEGLLKRLRSVPAVRTNKVYYVSDYLYRLGPRTVMGVEELARYLQQL